MQTVDYCKECKRPLSYIYKICMPCKRRFVKNGYEDKRITLGQVGRDMINHQQSLHTRFFSCNAPIAYRGIKENRIYYKIDTTIIEKQANKLNIFLQSLSNKHGYLYRHIPNISKRMLYNSTLFFLHYVHKDDTQLFNTHIHLKSSIVNMVLIMIENTYLRTNDNSRKDLQFIYQERLNYSTKTHDSIYSIIEKCCEEIINNLYNK